MSTGAWETEEYDGVLPPQPDGQQMTFVPPNTPWAEGRRGGGGKGGGEEGGGRRKGGEEGVKSESFCVLTEESQFIPDNECFFSSFNT